jgi:hypothetical protein
VLVKRRSRSALGKEGEEMRHAPASRRRPLLALAVAAVAVLLPASGHSRVPEDDGSTYTWAGAATLTVDVKPWGGGFVRSDPYLVDCPLACVRPFDQNREVKLTAFVTPGHTFKAWEGACAGQGNPCTLKVTGALVDVTAVFTGQYVPPPPAPPAPSAPPAVNPSLAVETGGLTATITGTGYNPNSPVALDFEWSMPPGWILSIPDATTSDATGAWSFTFDENCDFGGPYSGPVEFSVTGTDDGGASASGTGTMTCGST